MTKFWYPGISVCIKSTRRLLWHIFLLLEVSRISPRGLMAFFFGLRLAGAEAVVLTVRQLVVLGSAPLWSSIC